MKRKIVSALLVMSMAASLVACGNSGSGSSDPADECKRKQQRVFRK